MPDGIDLEQKHREEARWRILRALDAGRPIGVNETILWRVLCDSHVPLSIKEVRRELTYLRGLGLILIGNEDTDTWYAELTPQGVDVVEYTIIAPAGIARPRKYW